MVGAIVTTLASAIMAAPLPPPLVIAVARAVESATPVVTRVQVPLPWVPLHLPPRPLRTAMRSSPPPLQLQHLLRLSRMHPTRCLSSPRIHRSSSRTQISPRTLPPSRSRSDRNNTSSRRRCRCPATRRNSHRRHPTRLTLRKRSRSTADTMQLERCSNRWHRRDTRRSMARCRNKPTRRRRRRSSSSSNRRTHKRILRPSPVAALPAMLLLRRSHSHHSVVNHSSVANLRTLFNTDLIFASCFGPSSNYIGISQISVPLLNWRLTLNVINIKHRHLTLRGRLRNLPPCLACFAHFPRP